MTGKDAAGTDGSRAAQPNRGHLRRGAAACRPVAAPVSRAPHRLDEDPEPTLSGGSSESSRHALGDDPQVNALPAAQRPPAGPAARRSRKPQQPEPLPRAGYVVCRPQACDGPPERGSRARPLEPDMKSGIHRRNCTLVVGLDERMPARAQMDKMSLSAATSTPRTHPTFRVERPISEFPRAFL